MAAKDWLGFEPRWSVLALQRFGFLLMAAPALWALAAGFLSPRLLGATLMVGGDPLWADFPIPGFSGGVQLLLLSWVSCFITIYGHLIVRIAAHYGPWRINWEGIPADVLKPSEPKALVLPVAVGLILPLTALGYSVYHSALSPSMMVAALAAGLIVVALGAAIAVMVRGRLVRIYQSGFTQKLGALVFDRPFFGEGYCIDGRAGGHARMLGAWFSGLLIYIVALVLASPNVLGPTLVPAVFYGLLILFLFLTVVAGLAFYFDRWHVPTLVLVLVSWMVAGALGWPPDHFYDVTTKPQADDPYLGKVVADWAKRKTTSNPQGAASPRRTVVIVTAAGGGIQASAWTARVLVGLHRRYGAPFTNSVRVVSAVSGGSVGTMFYLANWQNLLKSKAGNENKAADWIVENASASSLEATAWGLAGYDTLRAVVPIALWSYLRLPDRGTALEQSWLQRLGEHQFKGEKYAPSPGALGRVRDGLRKQVTSKDGAPLPIPIFNATLAETGQRLAISPVRFLGPPPDVGNEPYAPTPTSADEFARLYPHFDIDAATAVRLSASFSFVSPISRPRAPDRPALTQGWIADGGYADNEGLAAALDALKAIQLYNGFAGDSPIERVLLLRISAFPEEEFTEGAGAPTTPAPIGGDGRPFRSDDADEDRAAWRARMAAAQFGWHQVGQGPFDLLQQTRVSVQAERNDRELVLWHQRMPLVANNQKNLVAAQARVAPPKVRPAKAAAKAPPAAKLPPREVPPELRTDLLYRALADDLERSSRRGAEALRRTPNKSKPLQLLSLKLNYQRRRSDEEIPLSWRLTPAQQKNLDEGWEELQKTFDEAFAHTPTHEPISLDSLFRQPN